MFTNGSDAGAAAEPGRVASFFAGKDVFITGGSGFVGRVLIEKLLREAPDIGTIFLLVRPKKGVSAHDRIEKFTNVTLFDTVRRQQPAAMGKLHGLEGDAALLGLGLSDSDRALLQERVSVVFHAAASVRFDDPLPKAVHLNVRGTSELCEIALGMRRLEAFVHVSTAYSNCNRLEVEEKIYPPPGDWRTYVESVDKMDPLFLNILTPKLVENRINTYIFTKAMAEQVVNEYRNQLPIGIVRPSIVASAAEEPFPGWIDNFFGLTAMFLANGIGALHANCADPETTLDIIPVDNVVQGIVLAAVKLATKRSSDTLPVYNATAHNRYLLHLLTLLDWAYSIMSECTIPRVYKCFLLFSKNVFIFRLMFILIDLPISLTIDCFAWWKNQPRRMIKIHRRSFVGLLKLYYFSQHSFKFHHLNFLSLNDMLNSKEKERFRLSTEHILWEPFTLFFQRELKNYFFSNNTINPGRVATILELTHFTICGMLLFFLWKSSIITLFIRLSSNILKLFIPPLSVMKFI